MNGLYQRALEIHRQRNGLRLVPTGGEERSGAMEEIPQEERESILREIDGILAKSRIEPEARAPKVGKSGALLPFVVNLIVIAAVAGAVFLYTRTLDVEESRYASGSRAVKGAESQVVEALRQESAEQLGQKDQAIVAFRKKLEEATAERERLEAQTTEAIKKREGELAAEMASTLAAERERLKAEGVESGAADVRLRQYEEKLRADMARQAEEFERKAREEAARSAQAVDGLIAEYQASLSQAQGERARLQQQYQSREAELRSQYAKEAEALQGEKSKALAELARIEEQRRQEDLVMGRILSDYDEIGARIQAGRYEAALQSLATLRDSLDKEPARSLAAVQKRRPVELFLLGSLEELVRSRIERDSAGAAALVDTKARIDSIRDKTARADQRLLAKDYASARELYASALSELPEARASHERLQAMALADSESRLRSEWEAERAAWREADRIARAESDDALREARAEADEAAAREAANEALREAQRQSGAELAATGDSLMRDGDWLAALDRYRKAVALLLDDEAAAATLVAQVAEAGYRLGLQQDQVRRSELPDRIALMKRELSGAAPGATETGAEVAASADAMAATGGTAVSDAVGEADLVSLLRAKLLLWQIIGTEPVKSAYPELYDTMQQYFDAFASQERRAGRAEALREILALTETLRSGAEPAAATARARQAPATERESMIRLLDDLESMLRR